MTDHSDDIQALRSATEVGLNPHQFAMTYQLASDLLELHDQTGISLDNWPAARNLVESLIGHPITENGV